MKSTKKLGDRAILIGGGFSIKEGVQKGLWSKLKNEDTWSMNSIYKIMPYRPTRQLWVDISFFKHEVANLQILYTEGVELISRSTRNWAPISDHITTYGSSRERKNYFGKKAIEKNEIYYGRMGLVGQFGLGVALARGYKEIYLLGYDFGSPNLNIKNTHVYQDRIPELNIHSSGAGRPIVYLRPDGKLKDEIKDWDMYSKEEGVKIWNVSLISNLPYFDRISYDAFFQLIGE